MAPTLTFFSFISELLNEANEGLYQATEASKDQSFGFTIPKIEMELKCTILDNEGLEIVPSNGTQSNYYGDKGTSQLNLTFKLIHR